MTMLLDTHVILWAVFESHRLSTRARQLMADPANVLLFSAVSAWEIAAKVGTGRLTLHVPVTEFLDAQRTRLKLTDLPLTLVQAAGIANLPNYHKDPGDRLLVAQALAEGVPILTIDSQIRRYPVQVLW